MAQVFGRSLPAALLAWAGIVFSLHAPPAAYAVFDPPGTPNPSPSLTFSLPPPSASSTFATSWTVTAAASSTATPSGSPPPSASASWTESPAAGTPASPTSTETPSPAPPPTADLPPPPAVRINEIAWAGTVASAFDEWIELANLGDGAADLTGWTLTDGNDLEVSLVGQIPAHGFFLLERTDDSTILDVPASQIYAGGLSNAGERLTLLDADRRTVDTANSGGGAWPAGDPVLRASMARTGADDTPANWRTGSATGDAHDADGQPIVGSPGAPNVFGPGQPTSTPSPTSAPSSTATAEPPPVAPGDVLINEVAWAGTRASASDEWIELFNATGEAIAIDGWMLTDGGDVAIDLAGTLIPGGYYLLERSDDSTVSDIPADMIYSGGLSNSGESLTLIAQDGQTIDSANPGGRAWPAGDAASRASMERRTDGSGWETFTGYFGLGHDADGNAVRGTPRGPNSLIFPQPTATWIPGDLVINEVLPRPHYDWEGTGGVTVSDEFIELYNRGPRSVFLKGWWLDDAEDTGSRPHDLPAVRLRPGERIVFFRSKIHIGLNDDGDTVRLLAPNGRVIDQITYLKVRAYNLSYGRLPDGSNHMAYGLWPTPGEPNVLFVEPPAMVPPAPLSAPLSCPDGGVPWPRVARQASNPAIVRLWWSWDLGVCR